MIREHLKRISAELGFVVPAIIFIILSTLTTTIAATYALFVNFLKSLR